MVGYLIHGLTLDLPFACNELGEVASLEPAVHVVAADVPRQLADALLRQDRWDLSLSAALFRGGPRSARFLARAGRDIAFRKNSDCEHERFLHQLLFPVLAAVLWQRGSFVLHASSVISPQGAVLVTGVSGAGKSTTIARLAADGWTLQSDDISALRPDARGTLEVMAGGRHIHLDGDTASRLGMKTDGLSKRAFQRMKMAVPVAATCPRGSSPVAKIVFLHGAERLTAKAVRGRDKLPLLLQSVYGPLLPEKAALHYDLLGKTLNDIDMISIGHPPDRWTVDAVAEAICHG